MGFEKNLAETLILKLPQSSLPNFNQKSLMTTLLGSAVALSCFMPFDMPGVSSAAFAAPKTHRAAVCKKKAYRQTKTVYSGKKARKKTVPVHVQPALSDLKPLTAIQPENFVKPSRAVNTVYIHHTGVGDDKYDLPETIRTSHRAKGWDDAGYHFHIARDGTITTLRDLEKIPAAQMGHNVGTIAIVYHGVTEDDVTDAQEKSLCALTKAINKAYDGQVLFRGHKEARFLKPYYRMNETACPAVNYTKLLELDETHHMPQELKPWQRVSPCPPADKWQPVNGETCAPAWWLKTHASVKAENQEKKQKSMPVPRFNFAMEMCAVPPPPVPPIPSSPVSANQTEKTFLPPTWLRRRKDGTAEPSL